MSERAKALVLFAWVVVAMIAVAPWVVAIMGRVIA